MNYNNKINSLANFLESRQFDYFATFTTRRPFNLKACRKAQEGLFSYLPDKSEMFFAAEQFSSSNSYHTHNLIKTTASISQIYALWQKVSGGLNQKVSNYCKIYAYRQSGGASQYCSKYILKGVTDYDYFSDNVY